MQKFWACTAVAAVLCLSTAFAADGSTCPHQAPPCEPCGCDKQVNCTSTDQCGKCNQVNYKEDGCIPIPVADEPCRVLDPACCPGSDFCLVNTCRSQYTKCCPGACYQILSCIDWSCDRCGRKTKDKCGCKEKTCGSEKQACGCKQKASGCKEKSCGCKQKGCGKNKCGCQSKCGNCGGDVACHCYVPYTSPAPRHQIYVTMPPPPYSYTPSMEEPPLPPANNEKVVKVVGRG